MLEAIFRKLGERLASAAHAAQDADEARRGERLIHAAGGRRDAGPVDPTTIRAPTAPGRRGEVIPPRPSRVERDTRTAVRRAVGGIRWYGAGEAITVGGYRIPNPLTYGAPRVTMGPDRACIDFSLPVATATGKPSAASSPYYASYRDLRPSERGAYLHWLAAGRTRFPEHPAFMSMFVAGIERRLLLDNCDGNLLTAELIRLLPLCPADEGTRPLIYKLLAYAAAIHHVTDLPGELLDVLVDQLEVKNNLTVDVAVLSWLSAWKKPVPAKWAWRLLWRLRVAQHLGTTREFAQHRDAFVEAFGGTFPEGFVLPLPRATRLITYYPASHAVLAHFGWSSCPPVTIPDVLTGDQLAPLVALWRACARSPAGRKPAGTPDGGVRVQAGTNGRRTADRSAERAGAPGAAASPEPAVVRIDLDPRAVQRVLADTEAAQGLLAGVFAGEEIATGEPPLAAGAPPPGRIAYAPTEAAAHRRGVSHAPGPPARIPAPGSLEEPEAPAPVQPSPRRETSDCVSVGEIGNVSGRSAGVPPAPRSNEVGGTPALPARPLAYSVTPAPATGPENGPAELPGRYRPILQALLAQADWERPAFVALVRRHHLMPADTIAAINTWAEQSLGDLLIEDNGELHVNTGLVETHG